MSWPLAPLTLDGKTRQLNELADEKNDDKNHENHYRSDDYLQLRFHHIHVSPAVRSTVHKIDRRAKWNLTLRPFNHSARLDL